MTVSPSFDPQAFRDFEHAGWEQVAAAYHDSIGQTTAQAVEPLLDAAGVGPGVRLLDAPCGPGVLTAAAAARGADAVGLDFSGVMVADAKRRYPGLEFREGDAEDLPYGDGAFDAVICSFGILHFSRPDRAIAEAFRVLAPGGRYVFSVWCVPEKSPHQNLVWGSIEAHRELDAPILEGPPMHRFSEWEESERVLLATGFTYPVRKDITLFVRSPSAEEFLDNIYKTFIRAKMVLLAQEPAVRERIEQSILEGARRFEKDGGVEVPNPAVLVSARKP